MVGYNFPRAEIRGRLEKVNAVQGFAVRCDGCHRLRTALHVDFLPRWVSLSFYDEWKRLQKPQRQSASEARRMRAIVKCRDHHQCRCCGLPAPLDVHELKRRGAGGWVTRENSVTLCRRCHILVGDRIVNVTGDNCDEPLTFSMSKSVFLQIFYSWAHMEYLPHIIVTEES